MKRFSAMFLAMLIVFSQIPSAFAATNSESFVSEVIYPGASEVVSVAARQHIIPEQESGQSDAFYLADSIPLYEVNATGSWDEISTIKYYPVLGQDGTVKGLVIATQHAPDENPAFEYNTLYCNELTDILNNSSEICFIFDQTQDYLYDGKECLPVLQYDIPDMSRGVLDVENMDLGLLERKSIIANGQLDLISLSDVATTGLLYVPKITQQPWKNLCWAASSISAGQYCNPSVKLSVIDLKNQYAGGEDKAQFYTIIPSILKTEYYVTSGTVTNRQLKMTTVMNSIKTGVDGGKPMVARAAYDGWSSGHFFVVCGFDTVPSPGTSYVTIMDPLSGGYRTLPTERVGADSNIKYSTPSGSTQYPVDIYIVIQ